MHSVNRTRSPAICGSFPARSPAPTRALTRPHVSRASALAPAMGNLTSCETSAPVPQSPAKAKPKEEGPPALFFAGPSGVGKGTIIDKLMAANPNVFGFSVSHTSRPPRPGEVDGVNCASCVLRRCAPRPRCARAHAPRSNCGAAARRTHAAAAGALLTRCCARTLLLPLRAQTTSPTCRR